MPGTTWPKDRKVVYVLTYLARIKPALMQFITLLFDACAEWLDPAGIGNVCFVTLDSARGLDCEYVHVIRQSRVPGQYDQWKGIQADAKRMYIAYTRGRRRTRVWLERWPHGHPNEYRKFPEELNNCPPMTRAYLKLLEEGTYSWGLIQEYPNWDAPVWQKLANCGGWWAHWDRYPINRHLDETLKQTVRKMKLMLAAPRSQQPQGSPLAKSCDFDDVDEALTALANGNLEVTTRSLEESRAVGIGAAEQEGAYPFAGLPGDKDLPVGGFRYPFSDVLRCDDPHRNHRGEHGDG